MRLEHRCYNTKILTFHRNILEVFFLLMFIWKEDDTKGVLTRKNSLFFDYIRIQIVGFRIPGFPGQSKEQDTEVRLIWGKIFRSKIRM